MKIHTETITLPAHWANPLTNGDYPGLEDSEEKQLNNWVEKNPEYGACFSCSEENNLTQFGGYALKHNWI